MQGKKREIITADWVLERVDDYNIYRYYIPRFVIGRKMISPLRKERTASFIIRSYNGRLYHRDYGNSDLRGDCFSYVSQVFGLTYAEAIKKVAFDFGLSTENQEVTVKLYNSPKIIEKPIFYQAHPCRWKRAHLDYWRSYYLTKDDLKCLPDTKVFAIDSWARNREKMPLDEGEVAFAYKLKNERGEWLKIYRPFADKEDKWRSSVPYVEMMGLDNMDNCNKGIITKSVKDAAVLAKFITPNVCVVQGENLAAVSPENIIRLNQSCMEVFVSFDSDSTGVKESIELTKETGWGHINTPGHLLKKKITDWADWVKAEGPEPIIEYFKSKNFIPIWN